MPHKLMITTPPKACLSMPCGLQLQALLLFSFLLPLLYTTCLLFVVAECITPLLLSLSPNLKNKGLSPNHFIYTCLSLCEQ